MARVLTSSEKNSLLRLASSFPAGNPFRKAILKGLNKSGTVFPSQEALKEYLKEHPNADPSAHSVKENKDEGGGEEGGSEAFSSAKKSSKKAEKSSSEAKEASKKADEAAGKFIGSNGKPKSGGWSSHGGFEEYDAAKSAVREAGSAHKTAALDHGKSREEAENAYDKVSADKKSLQKEWATASVKGDKAKADKLKSELDKMNGELSKLGDAIEYHEAEKQKHTKESDKYRGMEDSLTDMD